MFALLPPCSRPMSFASARLAACLPAISFLFSLCIVMPVATFDQRMLASFLLLSFFYGFFLA